MNKHIFNMPDGTVLYRARDVDRYYGLGFGTTSQRIFHGWSDERCANNQRARSTHLRKGSKDFNFNMPDGKVLHKTRDVDRYYGLRLGTTIGRINQGWSQERCASNRGTKIIDYGISFNMPDGTVLHKNGDVDRYYGLRRSCTYQRLHIYGWTPEECAKNFKDDYRVFNMPDGTILHKARDVDRYYGLNYGITSSRIYNGWTLDECARNKRIYNKG